MVLPREPRRAWGPLDPLVITHWASKCLFVCSWRCRAELAITSFRRLKSLVGSEGLTLSATRELLDHISAALVAVARAVRGRG